MRKFLSILLLSLLVAGPALADPKATESCSPVAIVFNADDTSGGSQAINIADGTATANATFATAFAVEDNWVTNVPLKFSALRVLVDTAPAGVTVRTFTLAWDPPGATGLQNSVITGTTPSTRGSFGCSITGTATSCVSGASGKGVTVPVGSVVALRMTNTGAVAAAGDTGVSFCMTSTPVVGLGQ
jgi:hypothetical protein